MNARAAARPRVRLKEPRNYATAGAITGWAIAAVVMIARCGGEKTCGEQDPGPVGPGSLTRGRHFFGSVTHHG